VIPIKADDIQEGGGFDEGEKLILPLIREVDISKVGFFLFLARMAKTSRKACREGSDET